MLLQLAGHLAAHRPRPQQVLYGERAATGTSGTSALPVWTGRLGSGCGCIRYRPLRFVVNNGAFFEACLDQLSAARDRVFDRRSAMTTLPPSADPSSAPTEASMISSLSPFLSRSSLSPPGGLRRHRTSSARRPPRSEPDRRLHDRRRGQCHNSRLEVAAGLAAARGAGRTGPATCRRSRRGHPQQPRPRRRPHLCRPRSLTREQLQRLPQGQAAWNQFPVRATYRGVPVGQSSRAFPHWRLRRTRAAEPRTRMAPGLHAEPRRIPALRPATAGHHRWQYLPADSGL